MRHIETEIHSASLTSATDPSLAALTRTSNKVASSGPVM